jgi:superfamily II DNA or RNA helicase
MSEARCQHTGRLEARSYQLEIANEVIENLNQGVENVFISLQQGAGKTIIALRKRLANNNHQAYKMRPHP